MTMDHVILEEDTDFSLALMQKMYGPRYVEFVNRWDDGVAGTRQGRMYWGQKYDQFIDKLQASSKDDVFAILAHEGIGEARQYVYIGHMGVHDMTWPDGHGTTGSIIVDPAYRKLKIGTRAKLRVLRNCFDYRHLRKVCSSVKAFNVASLSSLLKCGYEIVGRRKSHIAHKGEFVDEILLEVFPETWRPIWERYQETGVAPTLTDEQRALVKKETNT